MDVREKLVKLLSEIIDGGFKWHNYLYESGEQLNNDEIASYIIAHGVTVQEWISVKEHLPQENEPEGKVCEQVQVLLINGTVSTGWCNRLTKMWWHLGYGETKFVGYEYDNSPVIAWQPLAQPPKGE